MRRLIAVLCACLLWMGGVVALTSCSRSEVTTERKFADAAERAARQADTPAIVAGDDGEVTDDAARPKVSDWPSLCGPLHNNVSMETDLVTSWSEQGPPEAWRVEIGTGYTSPVVADGRVVVMHRIDDREIIECYAAETGESLWQFEYATSYKCPYEYSSGPYSTPVLDGGHVYAMGAQGQLHCLELASGDLVWRRLLHDEFEVEESLFCVGASPLLEGDKLIFNLGARDDEAGIVALDRSTGQTLWTATDDGASYATPCAATIHGRRMAFVITFEGLVALAPETGEVYWSVPFRPKAVDSVNATSPIVQDDIVLMVTGPGPGSLCLRVLPDGGYDKLWQDRRALDSQFNSLVCLGDHVYGYSSKRIVATFRCVHLETGEVRWKWDSALERGSALAADGHVILLGEHGHLASLKVNSKQPEPVSMTAEPLLEAPCYSAPALSRGLLFLRNESTLLCLNLRPPQAASTNSVATAAGVSSASRPRPRTVAAP